MAPVTLAFTFSIFLTTTGCGCAAVPELLPLLLVDAKLVELKKTFSDSSPCRGWGGKKKKKTSNNQVRKIYIQVIIV